MRSPLFHRSVRTIQRPWAFFRDVDPLYKDLIDNESRGGSPDYLNRDDQITQALVDKALRAARFQYRLRHWRYIWQAISRWASVQYQWYVKQRLIAPAKRILNRVADTEKQAQETEKTVDKEVEPV